MYINNLHLTKLIIQEKHKHDNIYIEQKKTNLLNKMTHDKTTFKCPTIL